MFAGSGGENGGRVHGGEVVEWERERGMGKGGKKVAVEGRNGGEGKGGGG